MTTEDLRIPETRDFPPGRLQLRKQHILNEVAGSRAPGRRVRPRRGWLIPVAGAAATGAVAATVFVGLGTNGGESASAATVVLREAAMAARSQPPPARPAPGQYLYVKSVSAYLTTSVNTPDNWFSVLVPRVREIWTGPKGGLIREASGEPQFLSDRDRREWIEAGRPKLREAAGTAKIGPAQALDLPTDPDALYERLEREAAGHSEGTHAQMFTLVGDALRETSVSPEQRAALYEVAARIPGVELVGRVKDPAGRPGVAVAMPTKEDGIRHTLVLDPDTGALLSEEQVTLADNPFGYPEGTVIGHSTYLVTAVVDSIRERPRA